MEPPHLCQSCKRTANESLLSYRKGTAVVHNESFLQCDVCDRFACSDCLQVYDILSGYDFLCHTCAREFNGSSRGERGH